MNGYANMIVLERGRGIEHRSHHTAERYIETVVDEPENHNWVHADAVARHNLKQIIEGVIKNG